MTFRLVKRVFLIVSTIIVSFLFVPPYIPVSSGNSPFCGGNTAEGVSTALGCLKTGSIRDFTNQILAWAAGLGAGIAFLIIVYGGFQIATAAGDPKRVKGGQELIATALGALALIVLAVVALNFVGVRILDLSGLGFNV